MKKLTALLLTAAIMTSGAAAFSAEAEENLTAVPISADTDTRIAIIDVESEADIAGYINDDTIILDKNGNRTDKVPAGSRAVVQISANIIAVLDADVPSSADIDIYSQRVRCILVEHLAIHIPAHIHAACRSFVLVFPWAHQIHILHLNVISTIVSQFIKKERLE